MKRTEIEARARASVDAVNDCTPDEHDSGECLACTEERKQYVAGAEWALGQVKALLDNEAWTHSDDRYSAGGKVVWMDDVNNICTVED